MKLGFIGLGAMGLPMAGHLVEAGHEVAVSSRSRGPVEAALRMGAIDAGQAAAVAAHAEVTFLCVPNSSDVVSVVDMLLPALGPAKTVVDCSTIDPDVERAQHERVAASGAGYLDAPISGGTAGARAGTLTFMVGGEAATLEAARAAFEPMA